MKALTLIRPWNWAIIFAGKTVENRSWAFEQRGLRRGESLYIHGGAKYDEDAALWITMTFGIRVPGEDECPTGIMGAVQFLRSARRADQLDADAQRWFFGPVGNLLTNPVALKPVECPGQLGLWEAPKLQVDQWKRLHDVKLPGDGPVARIWNSQGEK